jgi:aspartyl-tRNA(Asn)/glutamyl-tRNA(Gln) amidotransferase subunit C
MKIDREEARRIAGLAHLELDDAALVRLAGEMTKILTYIDQLREVDVEGFEEHAASQATPFREDNAGQALSLSGQAGELVVRNAPAWADGFFVVPKVIGGE